MNQFTHPVGRRSATLTGYVQQTSSALPNLNVALPSSSAPAAAMPTAPTARPSQWRWPF